MINAASLLHVVMYMYIHTLYMYKSACSLYVSLSTVKYFLHYSGCYINTITNRYCLYYYLYIQV